MLLCPYACQTNDHGISRRAFLGASLFGMGSLMSPLTAKELSNSQKRVLVVFLSGGSSQLETWDPKPSTDTGGPFKAIPTSVTGTHICELLPETAKQMHRMTLVRGLNTTDDDHGRGAIQMLTGRKPDPALEYPHIGAVAAKLLGTGTEDLPGHIHVTPRGSSGFGSKDAAFLGPKFGSVTLADGKPPADLFRPSTLSTDADKQREELRQKLNDRFAKSRRTAQTEAYTESYDQAAKFIAKGDVLTIDKEDPKTADRYGRHDFGRHMLLARRLLEEGVTFVKVTHTNYDTHHENFDFHIEQLGEFDRTFATLLEDLEQRGMLERTLVVVMSEFGRTPNINRNYGRDHWGRSFSIAMGGCGIRGGAVIGATNAGGTAVTDRQVNGGHLFHTYFRALGLNPTRNHHHEGRPIPMADPAAAAINEVLA
jgi:uncharacterized protein (DUF1501 family)